MTAIQRRAFAIGFLTVLSLFVLANVYSHMAISHEPVLDDGFAECGFPFKLYRYGGFVGMHYILWQGLVADLFLALLAGIATGITCKLFFRVRAKRLAV